MRAILLSGAFALLVSLLGTRVAINQFRRLGWFSHMQIKTS